MVVAVNPGAVAEPNSICAAQQSSPQHTRATAPPQPPTSAQPINSLELPPLINPGPSFTSPPLRDIPLSPTFSDSHPAALRDLITGQSLTSPQHPLIEVSTLERQLTASTATPAKLSPVHDDDHELGLDLRAPVTAATTGMDALRALAAGDCLDSESDDGDWEIKAPVPRVPGEPREPGAEGGSDDEFDFPMRHCINCTHKMPEDVPVCEVIVWFLCSSIMGE